MRLTCDADENSRAMNDYFFYAAAVVAVICTGLSKAGFAGLGIVATPLLAIVVPPLQAVAILLPIMILQDLIAVWVYRREWDKRNLVLLLPASGVGVIVAWTIAAHFPDAYIRLLIGIVAMLFALHHWSQGKDEGVNATSPPGVLGGVFWGVMGGLSGTLANAAGPPFQMYVLPQRLDKLTFAGTMAFYFAALNIMKIVPILSLGQFSSGNLSVSLVLLPISVTAVWVGVWIVRALPKAIFYRVAYTLLFVVALELIIAGVWQLSAVSS